MTHRNLEVLMVAGLGLALGAGCRSTRSDTQAADHRAANTATAQAASAADPQSAANAAVNRDLRDALLSLERVHFSLDSIELHAHARDALQAAAHQLAKYPDVRLSIDGHADERGTVEHNLALGDRRARAVADYLVRLGIPASRLEVVSLGEERPLVDGDEAAALAANRRVDFRLLRGGVRLELVGGKLVDDAGRPLARQALAGSAALDDRGG